MTQEDKELLLKDLCARLPYRVVCKCYHTEFNEWDGEPFVAEYDDILENIDAIGNCLAGGFSYDIEEFKPYLRPMSSMTEEEYKEYYKTFRAESYGRGYVYVESVKSFDWLNKHHFDYRGLIEKGLALEAPKGMYN